MGWAGGWSGTGLNQAVAPDFKHSEHVRSADAALGNATFLSVEEGRQSSADGEQGTFLSLSPLSRGGREQREDRTSAPSLPLFTFLSLILPQISPFPFKDDLSKMIQNVFARPHWQAWPYFEEVCTCLLFLFFPLLDKTRKQICNYK